MDDKILSHAKSYSGETSRKQGGTNMNEGPMSMSDYKSGEKVPSEYTSHDMHMCKQGGKGREKKSI